MKTFDDLRNAGFENVSFDLIAGLPGQTLDGWQQNVKQALDAIPNISRFICSKFIQVRRSRTHSPRDSNLILMTTLLA